MVSPEIDLTLEQEHSDRPDGKEEEPNACRGVGGTRRDEGSTGQDRSECAESSGECVGRAESHDRRDHDTSGSSQDRHGCILMIAGGDEQDLPPATPAVAAPDADPRHEGWPCFAAHIAGNRKGNQHAAWVSCKRCGLRMSYEAKGTMTGQYRSLGAPPEMIAMAQEELRMSFAPSEMNEKIFAGKLLELRGRTLVASRGHGTTQVHVKANENRGKALLAETSISAASPQAQGEGKAVDNTVYGNSGDYDTIGDNAQVCPHRGVPPWSRCWRTIPWSRWTRSRKRGWSAPTGRHPLPQCSGWTLGNEELVASPSGAEIEDVCWDIPGSAGWEGRSQSFNNSTCFNSTRNHKTLHYDHHKHYEGHFVGAELLHQASDAYACEEIGKSGNLELGYVGSSPREGVGQGVRGKVWPGGDCMCSSIYIDRDLWEGWLPLLTGQPFDGFWSGYTEGNTEEETLKSTPVGLAWVSMSCTRLSALQNLTPRDEFQMARFLKKRGQDLRRSEEVVDGLDHVLRGGGDLAWEWPTTAVAGWKSRAIRKLEACEEAQQGLVLDPNWWVSIWSDVERRVHQEAVDAEGRQHSPHRSIPRDCARPFWRLWSFNGPWGKMAWLRWSRTSFWTCPSRRDRKLREIVRSMPCRGQGLMLRKLQARKETGGDQNRWCFEFIEQLDIQDFPTYRDCWRLVAPQDGPLSWLEVWSVRSVKKPPTRSRLHQLPQVNQHSFGRFWVLMFSKSRLSLRRGSIPSFYGGIVHRVFQWSTWFIDMKAWRGWNPFQNGWPFILRHNGLLLMRRPTTLPWSSWSTWVAVALGWLLPLQRRIGSWVRKSRPLGWQREPSLRWWKSSLTMMWRLSSTWWPTLWTPMWGHLGSQLFNGLMDATITKIPYLMVWIPRRHLVAHSRRGRRFAWHTRRSWRERNSQSLAMPLEDQRSCSRQDNWWCCGGRRSALERLKEIGLGHWGSSW